MEFFSEIIIEIKKKFPAGFAFFEILILTRIDSGIGSRELKAEQNE
jgi:hypothetical protein